MKFRRLQSSAVAAFIGAAFVPIPAAYGQAEPLTLELAREINTAATQAQRAATTTPGVPGRPALTDSPELQRAPRSPVTSTERAGLDDPDRGAIFLRADRLEGTASIRLEASGNVELRTRRETILADSLSYDVVADEIWGRGEVVLRRGFDWITGPELKFNRETETGFFASPRFYAGETGARGDAREIRFLGSDKYEASDARYTTCVAPNNDWYLRSDEIEVDKLRKVGTARGAKVYFLDQRAGLGKRLVEDGRQRIRVALEHVHRPDQPRHGPAIFGDTPDEVTAAGGALSLDERGRKHEAGGDEREPDVRPPIAHRSSLACAMFQPGARLAARGESHDGIRHAIHPGGFHPTAHTTRGGDPGPRRQEHL